MIGVPKIKDPILKPNKIKKVTIFNKKILNKVIKN
jgi:hypothetical protein